MDPYISISSNTPVQPDTDSAADQAKADDRRSADRARMFKQSLVKPGGTAANAAAVRAASARPGDTTGKTLSAGEREAAEMPLSPAMLRLREEGTWQPQPLVTPQGQAEPEAGAAGMAQADSACEAEAGAQALTDMHQAASSATADGGDAAMRVDDREARRGDTPLIEAPKDPNQSGSAQGRRQGGSKQGGAGSSSSKSSSSTIDPRLLQGPVSIGSPQGFQEVAKPQASRPVMPPTELVQQLVEFATVHRNQSGFMEFQLGLTRQTLGGLRIQLCAYGNRRVGLAIKGNRGGLGDAEVAGLVEALKKKNLDVVDVIVTE
jgi:hypothetical protein